MLLSFSRPSLRQAACFICLAVSLTLPAQAKTEENQVVPAIQYGYAYLPVTLTD